MLPCVSNDDEKSEALLCSETASATIGMSNSHQLAVFHVLDFGFCMLYSNSPNKFTIHHSNEDTALKDSISCAHCQVGLMEGIGSVMSSSEEQGCRNPAYTMGYLVDLGSWRR